MTITARLSGTFGNFTLDVDFTAPSKGVTGLLGPSGSGKTSLLRCIAGLEHAKGLFSVGDEVWQDEKLFTPTHRRTVGYVFQESSLFDHLTVRENLLYGHKRTPLEMRKHSFDKTVEMMGLERLLTRGPARLSGGERQRVAIARALMSNPRLLLMDEPLSSLDHDSKEDLLPFLSVIHKELNIPMFYVSHSTDEVARLADYLILLQGGRVVASGSIYDVMTGLDYPLALSSDAEAIIETRLAGHDDKYYLSYLDFAGGRFSVSRTTAKPGSPVRVRVAASHVSLALQAPVNTSILNIFPAEVEEVSIASGMSQIVVRLNVNGSIMLARITRKSADQLAIKPGQRLFVQVKSVSLLA